MAFASVREPAIAGQSLQGERFQVKAIVAK
jgi:hypothetical protein